jgi:hypothetical protein
VWLARMVLMMLPGAGYSFRIHLSCGTSRAGRSFVAAVERAISACGRVIVDMADFSAADQAPGGAVPGAGAGV